MKSGTSKGKTTSFSLDFCPPATMNGNVNTVILLEEEN